MTASCASCAEVRALLPARPLEALDEDELARLDEHLHGCSTCRERSSALAAAFEPLRGEAAAPSSSAGSGDDALWNKIVRALDEPEATSGERSAVASKVSIALVCSFCRGAIARDEAAYCASCLAPHHGECFREHGRCSTFACEETRTVRPADSGRTPATPRPRRVGRFVVVALVGGLGAAALVAAVEVALLRRDRRGSDAEIAALHELDVRQRAEALARIQEESRKYERLQDDAIELQRKAEVQKKHLLHEVEVALKDKELLKQRMLKLLDKIRVLDPKALEDEADTEGWSSADEMTLHRQIDDLFASIDVNAREQKVEDLIPLFLELDTLMRVYGRLGALARPGQLEKWQKRLEDWQEIRLSIKLQLYINEGNESLKAMVRAKQAERWDELRDRSKDLDGLADRMRHEDREEYRRNADALLLRGRALLEEATTLKGIARIRAGELALPTSAWVSPRADLGDSLEIELDGTAFVVSSSLFRRMQKVRADDGSRRGVVEVSGRTIVGWIRETEDKHLVVRVKGGGKISLDSASARVAYFVDDPVETDTPLASPSPSAEAWLAGYVVVGERRFEGKILVRNDRVLVRQTNGIEIEFSRSEVSQIVYGLR